MEARPNTRHAREYVEPAAQILLPITIGRQISNLLGVATTIIFYFNHHQLIPKVASVFCISLFLSQWFALRFPDPLQIIA